MSTGAIPTLQELIRDAVGRGMTRMRIAELVGCSRVQLWRLEKEGSGKETRLTRRVREVLTDPDPSRQSMMAALDRLAGADPVRKEKVLQLLQCMDALLAHPDKAKDPGIDR